MSDSKTESGTHVVSQHDMAWWKPVIHHAADHTDCEPCQDQLRRVAEQMQEVIDGERYDDD